MNMQLLPIFGLGLYSGVAELPIFSGLCAGLASLVLLAVVGNPLGPYVPLVNIPVFVNVAVGGAVHLFTRPRTAPSRCDSTDAGGDPRGEGLSVGAVRASPVVAIKASSGLWSRL